MHNGHLITFSRPRAGLGQNALRLGPQHPRVRGKCQLTEPKTGKGRRTFPSSILAVKAMEAQRAGSRNYLSH
jgi:hypothetical protein